MNRLFATAAVLLFCVVSSAYPIMELPGEPKKTYVSLSAMSEVLFTDNPDQIYMQKSLADIYAIYEVKNDYYEGIQFELVDLLKKDSKSGEFVELTQAENDMVYFVSGFLLDEADRRYRRAQAKATESKESLAEAKDFALEPVRIRPLGVLADSFDVGLLLGFSTVAYSVFDPVPLSQALNDYGVTGVLSAIFAAGAGFAVTAKVFVNLIAKIITHNELKPERARLMEAKSDLIGTELHRNGIEKVRAISKEISLNRGRAEATAVCASTVNKN